MFKSQVCCMFRMKTGLTLVLTAERSDCTGVVDERAEIQAVQDAVVANKRVEESALQSAINMCQGWHYHRGFVGLHYAR